LDRRLSVLHRHRHAASLTGQLPESVAASGSHSTFDHRGIGMSTFTTRDGVSLHYKDWGAGRPVVFIHGWPLNADMWDVQMHHLASNGFRCIAYDRRGFGRSDQPWTGYDYDTLSDDLATLIETLDLRDVILVGFSMGGGEVARYIGRHGTGRVAKAVLVGSVTPLVARRDDHPDGADIAIFDGIRAGILADRAAFFESFWPLFTGSNRPDSTISRAALDWTSFMALQGGLKGTLDCVAAFPRPTSGPTSTSSTFRRS
jgi:pimeloyl-ACP methyl ester carboxylesterase